MKKFLSVDWDYFFDCNAESRDRLFPEVVSEYDSIENQDKLWGDKYDDNIRELYALDVIAPEYKLMESVIWRFASHNINRTTPIDKLGEITNSHLFAFMFILKNTTPSETFKVVNVDFHHDLYWYRRTEDEINCSNWLMRLKERRPNMQLIWVRRADSELNGAYTDIDNVCTSTTDLKIAVENVIFDYVFVCRSDCWSPPHLDSKFTKMCTPLNMLGVMDSTRVRRV